jgi:hypothetical protein
VRSNSQRNATKRHIEFYVSRLRRLPERDRFSAFQKEVAQKILNMDIIDRTARCPRMEVPLMRLGPVTVGDRHCTPAELIRYHHHLRIAAMASGWTSSQPAHSNSHMPARNVLTMLAEAIFCIAHGRSVNLVDMVFATEMLPCSRRP